MTTRIPRCYQSGPDLEDGEGSTCLLPSGHEGPHKWTPDDEIPVRYRGHPGFANDE